MRKQKNSKNDVNGWVAQLIDGSIAKESEGAFWQLEKHRVAGLSLEGRIEIVLPSGQSRYIQSHTGSCSLTGNDIRIESRVVGFVTPSGDEIRIRVPEAGGKILVEVKKCPL